jgi:hypothetical protein
MGHDIQAGLIGGGLFLGGMLAGAILQKLYGAWKNRLR